MEQITKGYKVTNKDMKCQTYQFELGKRHTQTGVLRICHNGFHFCSKVSHCFDYYSFSKENRVFEIEAYGELITEGNKSATLNISLLRELTWEEVLLLANEGADNTGHSNTGDRNTGDRNTGYRNTGYRNTGLFCTETPPFTIFDQPSKWTEKDFLNSCVYSLMRNYVDTKLWVPESAMTDAEKAVNKGWKAAEGYVKDIPFKEAFQNAWHNFTEANKKEFLNLPNFDPIKFEFITGVKIDSKS
jgi:hypothetical protein